MRFIEKVFVVAFVATVISGVSLAKKTVECSELLNCQTCADETHCEDCPEGYVLDEKGVCRFDCKSKFGLKCESCTESKCFCSDGFEWNQDTGACVAVEDCSDVTCSVCGKGYDLIDLKGKCNTCSAVFGEGCSSCSDSKCLNVTDEKKFKICGAVAVAKETECSTECATLFPGCLACSESNDACTSCPETAVLDNGSCKYKMPACEAGKVVLITDDGYKCGTCDSFSEFCIPSRCTAHGCQKCKTGYAPSSSGGCLKCSETFPGCASCQEDVCTRCGSSSWTLTPNGCLNQNPFVSSEESNAGLIAGIVVACVVLVVIIVLAVYCIFTSTAKHGQIDPSLYEDDLEFRSASVL